MNYVSFLCVFVVGILYNICQSAEYILELYIRTQIQIDQLLFFVGPPKEDIFSWTPSKSYISSSFLYITFTSFSSVWVLMRFSCLLLCVS